MSQDKPSFDQHTAGPWYVSGRSVITLGGIPVAKLPADRETFSSRDGNACLIAAAPDLLAACRRVMQLAIAYQGDEIFAEVKAAVAKAEGKP
jgi:hypothetical protein